MYIYSLYIHVHIYIYTYVYVYIYIYTYIHDLGKGTNGVSTDGVTANDMFSFDRGLVWVLPLTLFPSYLVCVYVCMSSPHKGSNLGPSCLGPKLDPLCGLLYVCMYVFMYVCMYVCMYVIFVPFFPNRLEIITFAAAPLVLSPLAAAERYHLRKSFDV